MRTPIENHENDQLYFDKAFIDENIRRKLQFQLDHKSEIVQNNNDAEDDFLVLYNEQKGEYYIKNIRTGTVPCIIHSSGWSKKFMNDFGRYLASNFDEDLKQKFHPKSYLDW